MYKMFIGIDPGVNGGVAIISPRGIQTRTIPIVNSRVNSCELAKWLKIEIGISDVLGIYPLTLCYIENQWVRKSDTPRIGKLIEIFGCLYGILGALEIEYRFVAPKTWQSGLGIHSKQDAIRFCQTNYPQANLLATKKSRKPHDGIADALCIAHHAKLTEGEN